MPRIKWVELCESGKVTVDDVIAAGEATALAKRCKAILCMNRHSPKTVVSSHGIEDASTVEADAVYIEDATALNRLNWALNTLEKLGYTIEEHYKVQGETFWLKIKHDVEEGESIAIRGCSHRYMISHSHKVKVVKAPAGHPNVFCPTIYIANGAWYLGHTISPFRVSDPTFVDDLIAEGWQEPYHHVAKPN